MMHTNTSIALPTLQKIVFENNLPELKSLAKALRIRGFSKMRKAELTDAVTHELLDEWLLESILFIQDDKTFAMFLRSILSDESVKMEPYDTGFHTKIFFELYFPACDDGKRYVPTEVRDACLLLMDKGLSEKRKRCQLLHRYALAAANLYGIIPIDELIDIFNGQNAKKTDADELIDVLCRFDVSHMGYRLWGEYIVEEEFAYNNFTDVDDLIRLTDDKPRYVPRPKEFLKYADWKYYESSSHTMKLFQFLQKDLRAPIAEVADMVQEMYHACVVECELDFYSKFLADYDIIMTEGQARQFFTIIMEIHNNARLWSNKGYTPNELAALCRN